MLLTPLEIFVLQHSQPRDSDRNFGNISRWRDKFFAQNLEVNPDIVERRDYTGVGLITDFNKAESLKVPFLERTGIGCILKLNNSILIEAGATLENGYVSWLECSAFGNDVWPSAIADISIYKQ